MKGVEGIVLRKKGGPTKQQIKKDPNFDMVRRNNTEFGACIQMSQMIRTALTPLKQVTGTNNSGPINGLMKVVQTYDTSERGKRNVLLSERHELLRGYSFDKEYLLENFLTSPAELQISGDKVSVTVKIPELVPGVTFRNFGHHPYYRFIVAVAVVPDLLWNGKEYRFAYDMTFHQEFKTCEWVLTRTASPAQTITMSLPKLPEKNLTYIGTIALQFGSVAHDGVAAAKFGTAKDLDDSIGA